MSNIVSKLRHRRETLYDTIAIISGAILWALIVWGVVAALNSGNPQVSDVVGTYVVYAVLVGVFILISGAVYRATAYGNMILLGPDQFPELHAMVVAASQELGLEAPPKTFLYNSNGLFNAFARRLVGGQFVFLTSALAEAQTDEQIRFVIGHEIGHHAAGHLNPWLNFVKTPAYVVPFLMSAHSRSREYSCDSIGAYLSKDLTASRSALQMLGCGCRRLNGAMNCEAFLAQEAMVPPIFGFLAEIFRSHPRLTRRVAAIKNLKMPA